MTDIKERYQRLQEFFSSKISKGSLLFPELTTLDLANKDDNYLNRMALGGIVALLSYRQVENEKVHPINENGEIDDKSPYLSDFIICPTEGEGIMQALGIRDPDTIIVDTDRIPSIRCTPHYNLKWRDLCYKSGLPFAPSPEQIKKRNIENFGIFVLNGSLPFDILILTEAFPQVKNELEILFTLIDKDSSYVKYCQIKKTFLEAKEATNDNTTPEGDQFRQNLRWLRTTTLNNLFAGTSMYTPDGCICIANSVLKVAIKVGKQSVTQEDVDTFKSETEAYKQDNLLAFLCSCLLSIGLGMLLGILSGMLTEVLIGVLLTTPMPLMGMGAAVGAGIVGIGLLAFTIWSKTHPIDDVEACLSQMSKRTDIDSNVCALPLESKLGC